MAGKKEKIEEKNKIERLEKKMYLGPKLKEYGLMPGQIFEGEHEVIKEAIKKYQGLGELFIKIDKEFSKNKENINKNGTKENFVLKNIMKQLGGK